MNTEPTDRFFGISLSEWIDSLPSQLDDDAVGLWEIIAVLRRDFRLNGPDLEIAARRALSSILAHGGYPAVGSSAKDGRWQQTSRYGDEPDAIVDAIIAEWRAKGRDPDLGDIWFALPSFCVRQE